MELCLLISHGLILGNWFVVSNESLNVLGVSLQYVFLALGLALILASWYWFRTFMARHKAADREQHNNRGFVEPCLLLLTALVGAFFTVMFLLYPIIGTKEAIAEPELFPDTEALAPEPDSIGTVDTSGISLHRDDNPAPADSVQVACELAKRLQGFGNLKLSLSDTAGAQMRYEEAYSAIDDIDGCYLLRAKLAYRLDLPAIADTNITLALQDPSLSRAQKADALWYRAFCRLYQGRRHESLPWIDSARALGYPPARAWYVKGSVFSSIDYHRDAIECFDSALSYEEDNHRAWYRRGRAEFLDQKFGAALSNFSSAIAKKPDYAWAWYDKAVAHFKLKEWKLAEASCDTALIHKPDFNEARILKKRLLDRKTVTEKE